MKICEKKLETSGKDGEEKFSKLQCKLDEANHMLKKKERYVDYLFYNVTCL